MRSPRLVLVSAAMLTTSALASPSFADDTPTRATPPTTAPTTMAPPSTTSSTTTTSADTESSAARSASFTPNTDTLLVQESRTPNRPLMFTGGLLLVGTYATTAAFTAANGPVADKDLYIPVIGPWLNLANRSCPGDCNVHETRDVILIAGSGVLQGAGALMVLTSFFIPEKSPAVRISAGPVKMHVTPTAGLGAGGVGAVGTF